MQKDTDKKLTWKSGRLWRVVPFLVVLIIVGGVVAWYILLPAPAAYVKPAEDLARTIRPLGLETSGFRYRVPANNKLVVWVEVYRNGNLMGRASPARVSFNKQVSTGTIRISRVKLHELPGGDDRLKLQFEADQGWSNSYIELPEFPREMAWDIGQVKLTDEPRIFWAYSYTDTEGAIPSYRRSSQKTNQDRELVDASEVALIARAKLAKPDKDETPYSGAHDAPAIMDEALLDRMQDETQEK